MSESVLKSTLNFPSGPVDGYFPSFPSTVSSSSCRLSLADDIFSAFGTTDLPATHVNSEAFNTVFAISRRSNGGSENSALISELKACSGGSVEVGNDPWLLSSLCRTNGNGNGTATRTGSDSYDRSQASCSLSVYPIDSHLSLSATGTNSSISNVVQPAAMTEQKMEQSNEQTVMSELKSQVDEQLNLGWPSQGKQSDFLQRMASTISPSAVGETKPGLTMTERIQVPSSDHVAEIVGKNGQRIRHLREQLKVWVKTPARDELPVFEITGMPEKLGEAKRIIQQMSEHFSKVQQERLSRIEPNRTEDRLYVEQDKVGLIVGASGQTIRWVQQLSDTHIATPRKQESIPGLPSPQTHFTICGTRERVRFAKQLICEYVSLRCQGLRLDPELQPSPEATRLVHEFHARRQAEDTQRRGSAPASVTIATTLSHLSAADDDGAASAPPQSLAEVKRLWQEGGPPPAVWDGVLFGSLPPTSVPPPPMQTLVADRRYSVDAHSVAQHYRQQQQLQQQPCGQQRQFLFGLDLDGLNPLPKAKSHSEDPVLQAGSGVNGWM